MSTRDCNLLHDMSAAGQFTSPMLIFPRMRMSDLLMKDAPVCSIGVASPSGWTDSDLFVHWLLHFVKSTGADENNQQILILDGHHSHKTLDAVIFTREHGVPYHRTALHAQASAFRSFIFQELQSQLQSKC